MKVLHVKLGTQPSSIQLRYNYQLVMNKVVTYRTVTMIVNAYGTRYVPSGHWEEAMIDNLDPLRMMKV